jgi:RNA polymerase sigma-70 factor (family 1)
MNSYQNYTEAELTMLLSEGNRKAFEVIYRTYGPALYRYARKNIAVGEDCEEIVQEIFESLWLRRHDLRRITVLSAYLYQMARYKIIRYFQRAAVRKKYAEHYTLFEAVFEQSPVEERTPDSWLSVIEKGLAELPDRCRLAVKLRLTENLSNAEIALRMKITKGTVENYMVTALSHLKQSWNNLVR